VKTVRPVGRPRGIPYHAVRPYHGVFVYGPRPVYHRTYVGTDVYVEPAHMPERKVDRDDTVAVGLRAGSLWGGYQGGSSYADLGAGFNVRWRPEEALGLELAMQSYGQHNEFSDRNHLVTQATAQLFAAPWTRVSPFLMLGVTYEGRNIDDDFSAAGGVANYQADTGRGGLHVGLGIEFAIGDRIGLDFETRYIGFLDRSPFDPASDGQFQTTGGLVYHF
jgi:opacity protein-like surface antigen